MPAVDLSVVTFRPDLDLLAKLCTSVAEQAAGIDVRVLIHDNSPEAGTAERIRALAPLAGGTFSRVDVVASPANVGFGRGHNSNASRGDAPFLFVLNQDCILEPGAFAPLIALARGDDARVAAWELRQIPYEHPKAYDPATLDAPWVSGAATLFRRAAFDAAGGFESRIFMYGEDVDLSWRLRGRGWRLRYVPRLAVVHRTYREAAEVKPLQALGGLATNLALRARFGGIARTLQGLAMAAGEMLAPQDFPGRRAGIAKAIGAFFVRWPYFLRTRVRPTGAFRPIFSGWDYELRRDGAFIPYRSLREAPRAATPRVSILIRTIDRPAWLAQALASVAEQTWPNVEAVVIEDGPERSREVIERFRDRLPIVYRATGERVGRARAGNLALASATGEWLNFLDDDDLLFGDHVETLVEAVTAAGAAGGIRAGVGDGHRNDRPRARAVPRDRRTSRAIGSRSTASRCGTTTTCRFRPCCSTGGCSTGTGASPRTWTSSRTGTCGRATRSTSRSSRSRRRRRSTACPRAAARPPAARSCSTRRTATPSGGSARCRSRSPRPRSRRWRKRTCGRRRW